MKFTWNKYIGCFIAASNFPSDRRRDVFFRENSNFQDTISKLAFLNVYSHEYREITRFSQIITSYLDTDRLTWCRGCSKQGRRWSTRWDTRAAYHRWSPTWRYLCNTALTDSRGKIGHQGCHGRWTTSWRPSRRFRWRIHSPLWWFPFDGHEICPIAEWQTRRWYSRRTPDSRLPWTTRRSSSWALLRGRFFLYYRVLSGSEK